MNFSLALGSAQLGLSLQAQLVDSNGVSVGNPITTGFTEIGAGNYLWSYDVADDYQGGVIFQKLDGTIMSFLELNPTTTTLAPGALDSIVIENGINARQALSAIAAALAGVLQLTGPNTITIQAIGSTVTRITANVNNNGERKAVVLTLPQ